MISWLIRIGLLAPSATEEQDPLSHPFIARMDARMLADLPFPSYHRNEARRVAGEEPGLRRAGPGESDRK